MAPRILAAIAAIALVVGAFAIRGSDDENAGGSGGSSPTTIVCDPDLADACRAVDGVDVVFETSGATADRLLDGGELDADAWVTTSAWIALVEGERARTNQPSAVEADDVVARTTLGIAVWADRLTPLAEACGSVDWRCIGSRAGTTLPDNTRVQAGMPPVGTATGLVVAAAQGRSITGAADYASNDFDAAARTVAAGLADGQLEDPLTTMRTRGPGRLTAAAVLAADGGRLSSNFGVIDLVPVADVTADVVVATPAGGERAGGGIAEELRDHLVGEGWLDPAAASLADGDGLPAGSVLAAVRTIWSS